MNSAESAADGKRIGVQGKEARTVGKTTRRVGVKFIIQE